MNRCDRSSTPLACGSAARQDHPADAELPAERGERVGRAAAAGVDRALPVPDQLLRQRPDPPQRATQPPEHIRRLLREHQRARNHARPAQLDGHHVAAAGLPVADRDRLARLPQIALHQLPGPIDRALERAPHQEPRPHLAHVIVEDRLAARVAQLARELPQPLRLHRRLRPQLLADPLPERVELRHRRRTHIPRRRLRRQRPS